ncbi:Agc1p [Sugiyamaella lignohabitans]|uniref:Agc1p n=1 Tax=Sugiyamaella lignohabitans TaxID=796027 RepID=A0A167EXG0_9ASCO|nr:Agc1p [Sugiyamaella lignohabitans]ANB14572.1 Agc1p [Sugiyamaella lignohabitans]
MALETIAASVLGAVGSKLVFYPLDTIRTLQQTSTNFSYFLPIRSYFRGLGASLSLSAPAFTVYMVAYRETKRELAPYLGEAALANYIVSGAVSQLTSSFIWTPMEVLKARMQIHQGPKISTLNLASSIYRMDGIKGFFRGYWMGVAVFLPHSVVWWTTYEYSKELLSKEDQPLKTIDYGIASASASSSAALASNFLDVIKTRQQVAVSEEIARIRPDDRQGVFKVARNLIKEVGFFRAFFKGLHIRLLHSLPSSALAMMIVESINPDRLRGTAPAKFTNDELLPPPALEEIEA